MTRKQRNIGAASALALSLSLTSGAHATQGYFQAGFDAVQKSFAGGGVADSETATAIAINPAGLFDVGQQANIGLTFLTVWPEYNAVGTGFIAPGSADSNKNFYPLPVAAYSQPLDADNAIGLAIYGNGGLGSTYNVYNPNTLSSGVFGGGPAGVEVLQVFISPDYAHRFGNFSIGIAPVISIQRFGLGPLRIQGLFRKSVERHQPGRQLERRRRPARRRAVDRGAGLPPRRRKHNAGRDVGLRELSGPVRQSRRLQFARDDHRRLVL
jgi:long-chain fatty acid transport protein